MLVVLAVSGCGSSGADTGGGAASGPAIPTEDVIGSVAKDESSAALLPADVRAAGVVKFGDSTGSPPSSFYREDGKTLVGVDIDFTDAVARVLGVRVDRELASFEAILPALGSGKYQVGTGNFGVTEARKQTIDFVTYIDDGQGFAVRKDSDLGDVTNLAQLCGRRIGTGAGTTFEATLEKNKHLCTDAGKPAYEVSSFSENGATTIALQQRHIDAIMSTINGLRYAASQQPWLKFLNEFHRLDVGFALKKGSPLAPAFQAAVNKLIADGTYQRILKKWGTEASAIAKSEISPPEHP
ncbi:ABC transporter substrate-binding protein [Solihabitans fulvus]|uniref:ABC transporter substrate-binding protein n=2 Tax=Solihabitans fulvus TaxID=1892852 RepID=A0A5B2WU05_9PSEU|nr:ABC transporter substrate-binding protein [Solihabitans fulvus]